MTDQAVATQIVQVLQKLVPAAKAAELPETSKILTEALGVVGYEAAEFRIPHCSGCGIPEGHDEKVKRINRDRAVS